MALKLPSPANVIGWTTVLATGLSPFGPAFFDALGDNEHVFLYEYTYVKNPIVEWNRQINAALKRLDESIKSADELPKSLVRALTRELAINTPTLAAWADLKPFDRIEVRVANLGSNDLKDIRVQFHGCVGYDSHTTYPDALASQESAKALRSLPDPVTISYRKISRSDPNGTTYNAFITFFGHDASACKPVVTAELENGKSALGRYANINEVLQERIDARLRWERITDITFKLGLLGFGIFLYIQVRAIKDKVSRASA